MSFIHDTNVDVIQKLDDALLELRRRSLVAQLDLVDRDRLLLRLSRSSGMTQLRLAEFALVSQPRVSQILRVVQEVREGFSGASPYEIAERFAAQQMDAEQLVDELARWPYAEERPVDDVADIWSPGEGTFDDVERAFTNGLISADLYDKIVERLDLVQAQ